MRCSSGRALGPLLPAQRTARRDSGAASGVLRDPASPRAPDLRPCDDAHLLSGCDAHSARESIAGSIAKASGRTPGSCRGPASPGCRGRKIRSRSCSSLGSAVLPSTCRCRVGSTDKPQGPSRQDQGARHRRRRGGFGSRRRGTSETRSEAASRQLTFVGSSEALSNFWPVRPIMAPYGAQTNLEGIPAGQPRHDSREGVSGHRIGSEPVLQPAPR